MPDAPVIGPVAKVVAAPPRREAKPPGPCTIVIFGAGGDLTKRLLFPALYNLARTKLLPEKFAIIGVDLADRTVEDWRDSLVDMLKSFVGNRQSEDDLDTLESEVWDKLASRLSYLKGDMTNADLYRRLGEVLKQGIEPA
jgi:glucose-6-phosphate 1-dehydrogenase